MPMPLVSHSECMMKNMTHAVRFYLHISFGTLLGVYLRYLAMAAQRSP